MPFEVDRGGFIHWFIQINGPAVSHGVKLSGRNTKSTALTGEHVASPDITGSDTTGASKCKIEDVPIGISSATQDG